MNAYLPYPRARDSLKVPWRRYRPDRSAIGSARYLHGAGRTKHTLLRDNSRLQEGDHDLDRAPVPRTSNGVVRPRLVSNLRTVRS